MKSKLIKVVSTLTVLSCCVSAIPLQAPAAIVQATTTATNPLTTGEEQTEALHPKMINQATGEEFDQSIINYQAEIFLNDKFGKDLNDSLTKSINLFGPNNVKDESIPDTYEFKKIMVTSDADASGKTYTREIEQVIKVGGVYYALVKGTQQDYLKFTNENQIQIIYNRYIRVGFERTATASDFITSQGSVASDRQIISGISGISPLEAQNGINEDHEANGFYTYNDKYADKKLYYLPDFKSIQFARPAFNQVSEKSGTEENNTAMRTTANFYQFTDWAGNTQFKENLNNFSMMNKDYDKNQESIDYEYFITNSGMIRLENGIPSDNSNQTERFKLHFPTVNNYSGITTYYTKNSGGEAGARKRAMARATWAYITGNNVNPYEAKTIDGVTYTNDYPISKGGTVVFTLQNTHPESAPYKYHTHLNKLIINGENINLPISELRPFPNMEITQKYSRTTYTYLSTGELVAVSFVPMSDKVPTPSVTPWTVDTSGSPYYFVTIMNIQGDISLQGDGEKRADGSEVVGNDFVFLQDGAGLNYGYWRGQTPFSRTKLGLVFGGDDWYEASSILEVDHDLDMNTLSICSGSKNYGEFKQRDFPYGMFYDGKSENGVGIKNSRRLLVDSAHPLKFTVDMGSKANSITGGDTFDGRFRGRFYNKPNLTITNALGGDAINGYVAKLDKEKYWIYIPHNDDGGEDNGVTLYRIHVKDKKFKSFDVNFLDLDGNVQTDLTVNGAKLENNPYNNLVFPRTNVALTSSFDIDEFGEIRDLATSNLEIGTTDGGVTVTGKDESGFITIPDLPSGAKYYQLVKVNTAGKDIPLTNKKFLPGQKVFTGQFLPKGTDFGQTDGIDNNSVVTLKAVKVASFNPDTTQSKAELATDITKYDTVNTGIYAEDKVYADHFLSGTGSESPLETSAYFLVDSETKLTAAAPATDANSRIYKIASSTAGDKIWTLKSFGDNSYEIVSTNVTVNEKPKADIQVQNKEIVDPKTQNADGKLSTPEKMAWTTTANSKLTFAKDNSFDTVTIGQDSSTPGQVSINSVNIPINVWTSKANGDNQKLQIPSFWCGCSATTVDTNSDERGCCD